MIAVLEKYNGKYRIVSLAFDQNTKNDLLKDNIDIIYITEKKAVIYPEKQLVSEDEKTIEKLRCNAHNYDVYELFQNGKMKECYNDKSLENCFFMTEKCNSNCIMCPSPNIVRRKGQNANINNLIEIARHIPEDAAHFTITGGEPFMHGSDIFRFFKYLQEKFKYTEFLLLTNGRIFFINSYVKRFVETVPNNCIVAIPIHGSCATIHDSITQTEGSFEQTIRGIKNLLQEKIRVEVRIVVSKLNLSDINNIAKLISKEMQGIEYVSIMAMEMTGDARINRDKVWIPYRKTSNVVKDAVMTLLYNEIDVKLYNFPLCTVKKEFWTLCEKSISPDKVRYGEVCDLCKMKNTCGGVFAGTLSMEKGELSAII